MKKLLFLGVSTDTQDALAYAKSKGIYTIVTDYNSPEKSIEKQYADDFWCNRSTEFMLEITSSVWIRRRS